VLARIRAPASRPRARIHDHWKIKKGFRDKFEEFTSEMLHCVWSAYLGMDRIRPRQMFSILLPYLPFKLLLLFILSRPIFVSFPIQKI